MNYENLTRHMMSLGSTKSIHVNADARYLNSSYEDTGRKGEPYTWIVWEDHKEDIQRILDDFNKSGYGKSIPKVDPVLERHVKFFRATLDVYDAMIDKKVFSKEELYYRSLAEGHYFTDYVKKYRAQCFREATKYSDQKDPDFKLPKNYNGYDSILHERYLIHWSDRHEVEDVKYAFLPVEVENSKHLKDCVKALLKDDNIGPQSAEEYISYIDSIKNTKMYDPSNGEVALVRDLLTEETAVRGGYLAKRAIVPTYPGSTRDTGIGDPFTIIKVKALNMLARNITSQLRYSANATRNDADYRISRVTDKKCFLHLDFRKYGLTIPRQVTNATIEAIGEVLQIDVAPFIIHSFVISIDGVEYETERGTVLGWLDAINAIAISAILLDAQRQTGVRFDHVIFNDDVEIGFNDENIRETLRDIVLAAFVPYDILLSEKKTFCSKVSVFLEEYYHAQRASLDMRKKQLAVLGYAKSLVQPEPWKAKLYYAMSSLLVRCNYCDDRCKNIIEFGHETEFTDPVWAGGWELPIIDGMDYSLERAGRLRRLGMEFMKWKPPKLTKSIYKTLPTDTLYTSHEKRITNSLSSLERGGKFKFDNSEEKEELLLLMSQVETKVEIGNLSEKVSNFLIDSLARAIEGPGVT